MIQLLLKMMRLFPLIPQTAVQALMQVKAKKKKAVSHSCSRLVILSWTHKGILKGITASCAYFSSLCINQDGEKEFIWRHESSLSSSMISNAFKGWPALKKFRYLGNKKYFPYRFDSSVKYAALMRDGNNHQFIFSIDWDMDSCQCSQRILKDNEVCKQNYVQHEIQTE